MKKWKNENKKQNKSKQNRKERLHGNAYMEAPSYCHSMVKDIKGWKISSRTRKVVVKDFSCAKTKDMKSYVIPTVEQKPDNIILHTGTNDLKTIDTPEK